MNRRRKVNKYQAESGAARDEYNRYRACGRKVAFESFNAANDKWNGTAYQCPYCSKWHRSGSFDRMVRRSQKRAGLR